ncbi:hypothetical protein Tco_0759040 [Tanacetum coccineum]
MNEEETNEEEEANELYRDVNVNLEERDTEMTDALLANVQTTQVTEDTHVIITAATPEFEDRVKALEDDFSEFKQTNQFAAAVSSILGIVDTYLANKMNEAVKTAVQLQSDKLKSEAEADNEDFFNKIDENMKKIIKEQVKEQVSKILPKYEKFVNDQLKAEVLTRSSNQANTSHAVAANLSEIELKKILIDKMENNESIDRSIQQKTLYKALVDTYETDKDILETYGDTITFKRHFSAFVLNWLKVDTLTPELLAGLTYELMKGSCKSLVELEYFLEETFKEGDYNRLCLQDIEDMLLLLVPGKLKNLNVEECLALGISLRMFTRSVVLRRHVEDLQLGVESYQKKLNLTRPDTYRSDLK